MFATYQASVPSVFRMRCVPCALEGAEGEATFLVSASSGFGLAACGPHREVTVQVVGTFTGGNEEALRMLFALAEDSPTS